MIRPLLLPAVSVFAALLLISPARADMMPPKVYGLFVWCTQPGDPPPRDLCDGYIQSVIDGGAETAGAGPTFCLPPNTGMEQIRQGVVEDLEKVKPADTRFGAWDYVVRSLARQFPCAK